MKEREERNRRLALLALACCLLLGVTGFFISGRAGANPCAEPACGNTITVLQTPAQYIDLALDGDGNPAIGYSGGSGEVRVIRCDNPSCANADGGVELAPDGQYVSLELDGQDRPVVAFYGAGDLMLARCDDPGCSSVAVVPLDTAGDVGRYASLALDAEGRPVIAYLDSTNGDQKVLRCGDALCSAGNVATSPDTAGAVGEWASLELDPSGYPVVAYHDDTNNDLKLLHCNDAACAPGGESIAVADGAGDVGVYASLEIDAAGRPVVSYRDVSNFDLKVLRCGNANCTAGNVSVSPDTAGFVGSFSSLALDGGGRPVVSYWDASHSRLKVLRCGDPTCSDGNAIAAPDDDPASTAPLGQFTSLAIDGEGLPAVAYTRTTGVGLGVLRCVDPVCAAGDYDSDGCQDAQESMTAAGTEFGGGRRDPKNAWDYFNPTGDGSNRMDDVLAVLDRYYQHEFLLGTIPITNPNYSASTDRTYLGPSLWNLGPPNGRHNVDDVIAARNSFMHDCS